MLWTLRPYDQPIRLDYQDNIRRRRSGRKKLDLQSSCVAKAVLISFIIPYRLIFVQVLVVKFVCAAVMAEVPDLSHLTPEERRIIEGVMMRQKQEEEQQNEIVR